MYRRIMVQAIQEPDAVAGQKPTTEIVEQLPAASGRNGVAAQITDKRGFGARWMFKPRTVDKFLQEGLPHLKIGSRRVRIVVSEGDAWMVQRYGTQRT
jgi:hypothetical protein